MATLTADVTAEQITWNVSAMPDVGYLQVDDEIVRVLDQRRQENRLRVERGYAGTTAATHSADAELIPVYVPSSAGADPTELAIFDESDNLLAQVEVSESGGDGAADLIAGNSALTIYGSLSLSVGGTILSFTDGNDALQITLGDSFGTTGVHIAMGDGVTEAKLRVTAAGVEIEGLPTVNPGVGNKVWNDGGTLKITAPA